MYDNLKFMLMMNELKEMEKSEGKAEKKKSARVDDYEARRDNEIGMES